ncbi:hypothetical protein ABIB85_004369 [Bradyrhizobium sp. JR1.5]
MHRRKANGNVDPRPCCQDFYAAMRLKLSALAPLLDASNCQSRPASAYSAALCRRSGTAAARSTTKRPRDAARLRRYSAARRGHPPALDADPLRAPADHRKRWTSHRLHPRCLLEDRPRLIEDVAPPASLDLRFAGHDWHGRILRFVQQAVVFRGILPLYRLNSCRAAIAAGGSMKPGRMMLDTLTGDVVGCADALAPPFKHGGVKLAQPTFETIEPLRSGT